MKDWQLAYNNPQGQIARLVLKFDLDHVTISTSVNGIGFDFVMHNDEAVALSDRINEKIRGRT